MCWKRTLEVKVSVIESNNHNNHNNNNKKKKKKKHNKNKNKKKKKKRKKKKKPPLSNRHHDLPIPSSRTSLKFRSVRACPSQPLAVPWARVTSAECNETYVYPK